VIDIKLAARVHARPSGLDLIGDAPDSLPAAAYEDQSLVLWPPGVDDEAASPGQKVWLAGPGIDAAAFFAVDGAVVDVIGAAIRVESREGDLA